MPWCIPSAQPHHKFQQKQLEVGMQTYRRLNILQLRKIPKYMGLTFQTTLRQNKLLPRFSQYQQ